MGPPMHRCNSARTEMAARSCSYHRRLAPLLLLCFCTLLVQAQASQKKVKPASPCFCSLNFKVIQIISKMFLDYTICLPQLYIAYLGERKHGHPDDVVASHHDILASVLERWPLHSVWSLQLHTRFFQLRFHLRPFCDPKSCCTTQRLSLVTSVPMDWPCAILKFQ